MAVRPIDANAMLSELRPVSFEAEHSAVLLSDVSKMMREWVERQPTLTPSNEWVSRAQELDELYTKLQIVTGFTAEQLLEMFAAGYTLKKPDYSKHFEAMANLAESDPPNEPLTLEQLREMDGEPVYIPETNCWVLVTKNLFVPLFTWPDGEQCSAYDWYEEVGPVYRRPPEGEA